jgi:hypothetical protein
MLVFVPVLLDTIAVAGSQEIDPSTDELAFNQPSGAMPRVVGEEVSTGGFTSDNVEYKGFFRSEKMGDLGQPVPANPEILTATGANSRARATTRRRASSRAGGPTARAGASRTCAIRRTRNSRARTGTRSPA